MGLKALHGPGSGENPHGAFKRGAEKIYFFACQCSHLCAWLSKGIIIPNRHPTNSPPITIYNFVKVKNVFYWFNLAFQIIKINTEH